VTGQDAGDRGGVEECGSSPLGTLKLLKLWNKLVPPTVVPL